MKTLVVLLNGPVFSGKDYIAEALIAALGGVKQEFKETLYEATAKAFGVDLVWFKEQAKGRLTKEQAMPELWMHREEAVKLYEYLGKELSSDAEVFLASPREALIYTSEIMYKPLHGQDYFGIKASEKMQKGYNYVSDSGFKEEAQVQVDKFGKDNVLLVRIHRDGCAFSSDDSRGYIDLSEEGVLTLDLDNNKDISEVVEDIEHAMCRAFGDVW